MRLPALMIALFTLANASAHADQGACGRILEADRKTGSSHGQMKTTGYNFGADTPGIYGLGAHTCSYLRDEIVDGQAAAVYREQYQSKTGSTDAQIWISKSSGLVLREEQDGNVTGKGKGHIAYRWTSAEPSRAAAPAAQSNGKLPMYPRGRNLNDMPASAVAMGVPMVLETNDSVQTVDGWYTSNAPKACMRSTASQGVKYACPSGSIIDLCAWRQDANRVRPRDAVVHGETTMNAHIGITSRADYDAGYTAWTFSLWQTSDPAFQPGEGGETTISASGGKR